MTSKYLCSPRTERTTLPVRRMGVRPSSDKLYQWERDPGRLVTLLSKEEGEQNFKLPVLPNGQPTPGNNHSTPLAVIHFDEDLLVNFTPRCFVRSIEDGDYLSNSGVSCRERL